ncbi:MAG: hypothetical protein NT009_13820 [Proteobacteria bacterium]|nr:hypothetical protein [Pseudomonadota bacterium]
MKKQIHAIINLGVHFALHIIQLIFRFLGKKAPGMKRFRENYGAEGLSPLSRANRENLFILSGCIGCGLCRMTLNLHPAAGATLSDPESLSICLTRSLPDVQAARDSLKLSPASLAGASYCPRGISIAGVYDFLQTADKERV